ncbi:hypothetical protein HK407_01g00420 [Ordospora pajunii]|uniref:uncharacterized protein n=1 Tax=Ordospora pajunii TaxID=3039483 RepID=UPI0029527D26|nr:uncharacterized protein HK407_01g00420 [Ordospora pajunii]KAH9412150.1 hypothetical protein HK407_01g00420 [Ordospora pajunii]
MEERSFSLQFNPLQRIKTVKEYENEIEELRNENFELKHQLLHYKGQQGPAIQEDIQKLLVDSKRSIDILEEENEGLSKQVEEMSERIRRMISEREDVEKRLGMNVNEFYSKMKMLEEENGRLLKHLEGMNGMNAKIRVENEKLIEENTRIREESAIVNERLNQSRSGLEEQKEYAERIAEVVEERMMIEKELLSYKNAVLNLNKERDQLVYERERERGEYCGRISQLQAVIGDFESRANANECEMMRMREHYGKMKNEYEEMYRQRQSGELYVQEMKENYMRETKEKQELALKNEGIKREIEQLKDVRAELKKKIEVCENEKRALCYKVSQDKASKDEFDRLRDEMDMLRKEKDEMRDNVDKLKKRCEVYIEELEKSKDLQGVLKGFAQEKGKECDRRIQEVAKIAEEMDEKVCLLWRMTGEMRKSKGDGELGKQETEFLHKQISGLKGKIDEYQKMARIDDEGAKFLRGLGINPGGHLNEIVVRFRCVYKDVMRKMKLIDKEANEVMGFAENNKDVMHERTMKYLEEFTNEFNIARKDLEECKKYLEKKGKENKDLKANNQYLEKRFDECKRNEERIKSLYVIMADKLKKKDEAISRLEMRIGVL